MQKNSQQEKGTCVALGNFDGVHLGHSTILHRCANEANKDGTISVAWSFRRHPEHILKGNFSSGNILSCKDKEEIIHSLGIHRLVLEDFERVRNYSPSEFCEKILLEKLYARKVFCGFNFHFGKNGEGDSDFLKRYLEPRGVQVFISEPVIALGDTVSSTRIRRLLGEGEVEEASALLGRPYFISFPVLHGRHLGTRIGFPTLNQAFPEEYVTPKKGVYAVRIRFDGKSYHGICNVGTRPTVEDEGRILAETHIFDFSDDLYGKEVRVEFFKFLRPETKFSSLEELKKQIESDRLVALAFWKEMQ